jgi:hypothetical protein
VLNGNGNTNQDNNNINAELRPLALIKTQPAPIQTPVAATATAVQSASLQEQQNQQQQGQLLPVAYQQHSVKIEQDPKGFAKLSIHIYSEDIESITQQAVKVFLDTRQKLVQNGIKLLEAG